MQFLCCNQFDQVRNLTQPLDVIFIGKAQLDHAVIK